MPWMCLALRCLHKSCCGVANLPHMNCCYMAHVARHMLHVHKLSGQVVRFMVEQTATTPGAVLRLPVWSAYVDVDVGALAEDVPATITHKVGHGP